MQEHFRAVSGAETHSELFPVQLFGVCARFRLLSRERFGQLGRSIKDQRKIRNRHRRTEHVEVPGFDLKRKKRQQREHDPDRKQPRGEFARPVRHGDDATPRHEDSARHHERFFGGHE
ncbi:hypothetical protein SDC9_125535 [bioreactor metagenome]|uniref:Uncharacterized protein n=1 Tax=bioreactor metagenome TaxID=1076179 RepID=A0A645CNR9_9ZZZZ